MICGILCDVHGVLYVHPRAIPGSVQALARLGTQDVPFVLLTNSTQFPKRHILSSLNSLGFTVDPDRLLTSPEAAGHLLAQRGARRVGWLLNPDLAQDLPNVEPVDPMDPDSGEVDAVLVGDIGDGFTYAALNRAFGWLHQGATLVALARNRYYQTDTGLRLDSGPFVRLLEDAAQVEAVVAGKPSPAFFKAGLARLDLRPEDVAMIGDDLDFDVLPAMDLGARGVLVKTGKFRQDPYDRAPRKPSLLADDLRHAVEELL